MEQRGKKDNLKATDNWPYLSQSSLSEAKNSLEAHCLFLFFNFYFFFPLQLEDMQLDWWYFFHIGDILNGNQDFLGVVVIAWWNL